MLFTRHSKASKSQAFMALRMIELLSRADLSRVGWQGTEAMGLKKKKNWRENERKGWMLMPGSGWAEAQRAGKKALLAVRSWVSGEWKPTQGECLKLDIPLNGLSFRKADMVGGRRLNWGRVGKTGGLREYLRTPKKDIKTKSRVYYYYYSTCYIRHISIASTNIFVWH